MSKAYQFPHDEPNPFADQAAGAPAAASDNPYLAGNTAASPGDAAPAYQSTLPPRGGRLMAMSLSALAGGILALVLAFWLLPMGIFSLAVGIPAWAMARHDWRAIQHGAMDDRERDTVRAAWRLAATGVMLSVLSFALMIGLVVWAVYQF